jgi:hypothetical protein
MKRTLLIRVVHATSINKVKKKLFFFYENIQVLSEVIIPFRLFYDWSNHLEFESKWIYKKEIFHEYIY